MQDRVIGTCSICGGRVAVPTVCHSVVPPVPTCKKCGAVRAEQQDQVIPMTPRQPCYAVPRFGPPPYFVDVLSLIS